MEEIGVGADRKSTAACLFQPPRAYGDLAFYSANCQFPPPLIQDVARCLSQAPNAPRILRINRKNPFERGSFMKRVLKWVLLGAAMIFVAMLALGALITATTSPEEKAAQEAAAASRKAEETAAAEVARLEAERKADQEKLLEIASLPVVSAHDLAAAYERNTVAADKAYKGKKYRITGKVESISTSLTGQPYLILSSGSYSLMGPQLIFSKRDLDSIAEISKGDRISAICVGTGDIVKTAMSNECELVPR